MNDRTQETRATEQAPTAEGTRSPAQPNGASAVQAMLAHGRRDPAAIAGVMQNHPGAQNQILALLSQTLGSSFVRAVLDLIMPGAGSPAAGPAGAGGATGPMRVTAHGLHVRSSPSKANDDNVVGMLPYHAIVEASGQHAEWVGIEHGGKPAFVFGRYVEPVARPVARPVATTVASTPAGPAVAHPAPHESVAAVPTAPLAPAHHEVAPAPAAPIAAAPVAPVIAAPTPAAAPVHPVMTLPASPATPVDHPAVDHPAVDHPAARQPDPAHVAAPAKVDAAHKDAAAPKDKPKKQAPPSGFTRYGGGTVKSVLTRFANAGKLKITGNQIAQLDAVAQVETGGQVSGVDTTDDQVVSIGFHQVVLGHKSIEAVMLKAPAAFAKHGLTLDMSTKYNFASKPHQIVGAPDYDDLRGHDWGMKFYQASLEPEVIVAIAEFALAEATVVEGITRESGGTSDLFNDDTARAWLLEVHNNRPSYTGPSVKKAIENGAKSAKDRDHFLDILGAAIVDTYGVMEPLTILHNQKAALPKGKQLTAGEEAMLLEKLKAKYGPKGRTKGTHIITKMSRHLDIPKLDPAPAATAPAAPPAVEHHDAPVAAHHDAPAPVHHDAPAPVHHDAPVPAHHDAPAVVHHDAPAPVVANDVSAPKHGDAPRVAPVSTAPVHHEPAPAPTARVEPAATASEAPTGSKDMMTLLLKVDGQACLVYIAPGGINQKPDVFVFFHGHDANLGIDPKLHGGNKSGADSAGTAMAQAKAPNTIAILPQGVQGAGATKSSEEGGVMHAIHNSKDPKAFETFLDDLLVLVAGNLGKDGKLTPAHISIAGHSAGGYLGVHDALSHAGGYADTISDITLMDSSYSTTHFNDTANWLFRDGHPGKTVRIVESADQLVHGYTWDKTTGARVTHDAWHHQFFDESVLDHRAKAKHWSIKSMPVGDDRGNNTTVKQHTQLLNKDGAVQGDVLILESKLDHHTIRDNVMDDSIDSIGHGGEDAASYGKNEIAGYGRTHGAPQPSATVTTPAKASVAPTPAHAKPAAEHPAEHHGATEIKHADAAAAGAAAKELPKPNETEDPSVHVLPTPQHQTGEPSDAPEVVKPPKAVASKPKSKSGHYVEGSGDQLREGLYGKDGLINKTKLGRHNQTTVKGKKIDIDLTDVEYDFKQRVYTAAVARLGKARLFGGVPDEELTTLDGGKRIRHAVVSPLNAMLDACRAAMPKGYDIKVGSAYRDPVEDFGLWNDGFDTNYLWNTKKHREDKWPDDPYGKEAVDYMVWSIGQSKAAPGGSNHSNGIAVDLHVKVDGEWVHATFAHQEAWYASKQFEWLHKNAKSFGFKRYEAEAWHYDYKP